jgi:hypothetical protein
MPNNGNLTFEGTLEALQQRLLPLRLDGRWEMRPNGVWMLRCRDGANLHWSSTKGTLWCDGKEEARETLRRAVERCVTAISNTAPTPIDGLVLVHGTSAKARDDLELTLRRHGRDQVFQLDTDEDDQFVTALARRLGGRTAGAFLVTPITLDVLSGKPERVRADEKPLLLAAPDRFRSC